MKIIRKNVVLYIFYCSLEAINLFPLQVHAAGDKRMLADFQAGEEDTQKKKIPKIDINQQELPQLPESILLEERSNSSPTTYFEAQGMFTMDLVRIAKNTSLFEGQIRRDQATNSLEQIIIEEVGSKEFQGVSTETRVNVKIRCQEAKKAKELRNDDCRLESIQSWQVIAKRNNQEREIQEIIFENLPYILKTRSLRKIGNPILESGIPYQQVYKGQQIYIRGDNTEYLKEGEDIVLPLHLIHKDFYSDMANDCSYQIVDTYATYEGQRYKGIENYRIQTRPFKHLRILENSSSEFTKNRKVFIDPQGAIQYEEIAENQKLRGREILIHTPQQLNNWEYDDVNLRAYRVYFQLDSANKERSEEFMNYSSPEIRITPIGNFTSSNGIPTTQMCDLTLLYRRPAPNNSEYEQTSRRELPLQIIHMGFRHDIRGGRSYQQVALSVPYGSQHVTINQSYEIRSRIFEHQQDNITWEDNKKLHESNKFVRIYINTSGALASENIEEDIIVDPKKKIETQKHSEIWVISHYLPGRNYKILHSEETY